MTGRRASRRGVALVAAFALGLLPACARSPEPEQAELGGLAPYRMHGHTYAPLRDWEGYREEGLASWYGGAHQGERTASGERFDADGALTAAHRTLPFNVCAQVENLASHAKVLVRINDRGPFVGGRLIDLSRAAAERIGLLGAGVGRVRVRAVGVASTSGTCPQP